MIHKPPVIRIIKVSSKQECFLRILTPVEAAAAAEEAELLLFIIIGCSFSFLLSLMLELLFDLDDI